ncbi:MAG: metallophosphoesterase [Flavobacterium sp.]|nr:metallophosphoesterase [Flavobacterium sp.]
MTRWIILGVILLLVEVYAFQAVRTIIKAKWLLALIEVASIAVYIYVFYILYGFDRSKGQTLQSMFAMGLMLVVLVPKMFITIIMLIEDIFRILSAGVALVSKSDGQIFPERRKFISQIALGIAAVPFLSFIYGIAKGKYDFRVIRTTLFYDDLPDAFDGFQITHISDIHSGSFDNKEKIEYAIDLINMQNSDAIFFTGDIVNTHATEMYPWIDTFKKINMPKYGKFSVLGNHDYGEYIQWPSSREKLQNFEDIKGLHDKIDFKLLLNESVKIRKDGAEINVVGVENWGHNFKKAGDLNLASKDLTATDFKILMTHDPSHWEYEVKQHPKNFQLSLCGHTHGFQFGIEIPGVIKWSPVQYVYKQWAGLYENLGRYVYVNRGFGFHAYAGRVGIWPEITVIELKKRGNVA